MEYEWGAHDFVRSAAAWARVMPVVRLRTIAGLFAAALLGALPTSAGAQGPTPIEKSEARILIDLPELAGHREAYFYAQPPHYGFETYVAVRLPVGARNPIMAARLIELAPGGIWPAHREINENFLAAWLVLRGRQISDMVPARGGGNSQRQLAPFRSDGAPCFAFALYLGSVSFRGDMSDPASRQQVSGVYCGTVGTQLSEAEITRIVSGIRVVNRGAAVSISSAMR